MSASVPALPDDYVIEAVPLKGSPRSDWTVKAPDDPTPADRPDFVKAQRKFFADLYDEIDRHIGDPIALGRALTKVEAIAADVRAVASRLRTSTAEAMNDREIRRLIMEGVGVWEASSSIDRSNWNTAKLVADYLTARGIQKAVTADGEFVGVDRVADEVAQLYGPSTGPRMTPMKDAGLKPNDYCDVKLDEDGNPIRTPGVIVKVNDSR